MSMFKNCAAAALAMAVASGSIAAFAQMASKTNFGFGTPVKPEELKPYFSIQPDGKTLPAGSGTAAKGQEVYATNCVACHGEKLEGIPTAGIGGDKLIGGRGSLATAKPVKTVESYWPYATTLFDYIKRAMPFAAPGSLTDDEVYAVVAYVLSEAKIIKPDQVIDAQTLPKVEMPNRDGFIPDARPELRLYD